MHMRLARTSDDIVLNAERSGYTMCFPGGGFAQMQSNMAATLNIDWLLDVAVDAVRFAGHESTREALLPGSTPRWPRCRRGGCCTTPTSRGPGERGPFTDPDARAGFTGLDTGAGFATLARAVYEGLALAARDCFDAMGERPAEIRLGGGAARSAVLRTLLSAALDRPLRLVEREEAGAAGACMIAATGLGLYPDIDACCHRWVDSRLGEAVLPERRAGAALRALAPVYRDTREALGATWARWRR